MRDAMRQAAPSRAAHHAQRAATFGTKPRLSTPRAPFPQHHFPNANQALPVLRQAGCQTGAAPLQHHAAGLTYSEQRDAKQRAKPNAAAHHAQRAAIHLSPPDTRTPRAPFPLHQLPHETHCASVQRQAGCHS